ncbi:unnamed protein product [Peronospora belbahrii]|uniref:PSI domain-containing protein n=1 Tax=Peronospora belbahrii TaxID=622444 RepID=A0AAU9KQA2_9STRA|nr:unnamed protein product [Peronospora belbahrii]CAH0516877.1 unnamed protein product [Peronospora belbahrii]
MTLDSSRNDNVIDSSSSLSNDNITITLNENDLNKSVSSNTDDSCTWYVDSKCTRPRTCFDCLNVPLSTNACAIDPSGVCVSLDQIESYLASQNYYIPPKHYYTSSEYTYCNADDSKCASCSDQWKTNFVTTGSPGMSSLCTGTDGCVCIADCETPNWQDMVIEGLCSSDEKSLNSMTPIATNVTVSLFVGVAVAVLLAVATWGARRLVNRGENESSAIRRDSRTRARPAPIRPQLSLAGWKSLRRSLIESEHGYMNGSDTMMLQRNREDTLGVENVPTMRVEQEQGFRSESRA